MLTSLKGFFLKICNNYFLLLLFVILLPPVLVEQVRIGIDPSWKIALGLANLNGLVFGRDIVFTYGPLHFLITKVGVLYSYKWIIATFEFVTIGLVVYIISQVSQRESHRLKWLFLLVFCFLISDVSCEYYLLLIFLFAVYQVLVLKNYKYLYFILLISVLTFFVKINYGFVNFLIMFMVFVSVSIIDYKKTPIILFLTFCYFVSVFVLSILLRVDMRGYLLSGIRFIDDYNDAMMLPFSISDPVDWVGVFILCIFCFLILVNIKFFLKKENILVSIIYCFYYFLLFKNGFVRIDTHIFVFIFNTLIFYLLLYIWNKDLKYFWTSTFVTMALGFTSLVLGFLNFFYFHENSIFHVKHFKEKVFFWNYGMDLIGDLKYKGSFDDKNNEQIKLDVSQLSRIANNSVDILPMNIGLLYRNKLNYAPRPVIQSYAAYSLGLDSLNYKKYISSEAPHFLLFLNESIDKRMPFWDESITKRGISEKYELIESSLNPDSSYLLFEKRDGLVNTEEIQLSKFLDKINNWIDVPKDMDNIYLYVDVKYSLSGKLMRLLFHAPILEVEFSSQDGTVEKFRCISKILSTGVLINKLIMSNRDVYNFYSGKHSKLRQIRKFRILGEFGFDEKIRCRFVKYLNK